MMGRSKAHRLLLDEAAAWYVAFSQGEVDAGGRREFSHWLRTSPAHVRAYLQMSVLWEDAPLLCGRRTLNPEVLIAQARREEGIVPLPDPRDVTSAASRMAESSAPPFPARRTVLGWGLAAASLSLVAGGALFLTLPHDRTYSTGIGEERSIALPDGSVVELNACSQLRIKFSRAVRLVDLAAGQALFRVAKDAVRPFVVHSGATQVFAIGTQFDVLRKGTDVTVTVVEGMVAVTRAAGGGGSLQESPPMLARLLAQRNAEPGAARVRPIPDAMFLSAGEQVTLCPRALPHPVQVDVAAATAWTQHKLIFNDSPLSTVADEYNRYHRRRLVVRGRSARHFHVSGEFSSADGTSLIEFLRAQPDLRVRETGSEIEIRRVR